MCYQFLATSRRKPSRHRTAAIQESENHAVPRETAALAVSPDEERSLQRIADFITSLAVDASFFCNNGQALPEPLCLPMGGTRPARAADASNA